MPFESVSSILRPTPRTSVPNGRGAVGTEASDGTSMGGVITTRPPFWIERSLEALHQSKADEMREHFVLSRHESLLPGLHRREPGGALNFLARTSISRSRFCYFTVSTAVTPSALTQFSAEATM